MADVQKSMGLLAFPSDTDISPYKVSYTLSRLLSNILFCQSSMGIDWVFKNTANEKIIYLVFVEWSLVKYQLCKSCLAQRFDVSYFEKIYN